LEESAAEPMVTEVAAGSGFLQPHLFDYFAANKNECAFCFGLRVTRVPCEGMVTCHGGVRNHFQVTIKIPKTTKNNSSIE